MKTVIITKEEIKKLRQEVLENDFYTVGFYMNDLMANLEWDDLQVTLESLKKQGLGISNVQDIFREIIENTKLDVFELDYMQCFFNYSSLVHSKLDEQTFYNKSYEVVDEDGWSLEVVRR